MSISEIARLTGAARNTVKAALASTAPPRYQRPSKGSVVDAVEPRIRELLREYPRMPATVIAERVGWVRGLTVFKERVAQLRPVYLPPDPASRTTYLPGEVSPHGPAEHARVATLIRLHNHALSEQATEPRTPSDPGIMPYAATSSQVTTIRAILNNMNILPVGKPRKSYADQDVQATRGLTSPNRTGLTSRLTSEDGSASTRNVVRPSLEVLRERRGRDARPDNLVEDVRACIQPVAETCCLSPTCHEVVSWPKTGGRPSRFCSRACQERFDRERGRLSNDQNLWSALGRVTCVDAPSRG